MPVLERKGNASSGGTVNPNQGFYEAAVPGHGVDHYVVWWVYFFKQILRFKTWIFTRKDVAETLAEMLTDIINYALICVTMLVQDNLLEDPTAEYIPAGRLGMEMLADERAWKDGEKKA